MGAEILSHLITGVLAVLVAVLYIRAEAKNRRDQDRVAWEQAELDRERQLTDRQADAALLKQSELELYREPLRDAAKKLSSRLGNIRNRQFLLYLNTSRGQLALLSTLYLLAHYLAWVDIRQNTVKRRRLESDAEIRPVEELLVGIARTLSSDSYDLQTEEDFTSSRYMLWREEQRAIGELMQDVAGSHKVLGFATFVERYDSTFSTWMNIFCDDLSTGQATSSERLERLEQQLAKLMDYLE